MYFIGYILHSSHQHLYVKEKEILAPSISWILYTNHRELDEVVGSERMPSAKDRPNLPFTEAVVMEIQRCANILTHGVGHHSSREIIFNGINIPANVVVLPHMAD